MMNHSLSIELHGLYSQLSHFKSSLSVSIVTLSYLWTPSQPCMIYWKYNPVYRYENLLLLDFGWIKSFLRTVSLIIELGIGILWRCCICNDVTTSVVILHEWEPLLITNYMFSKKDYEEKYQSFDKITLFIRDKISTLNLKKYITYRNNRIFLLKTIKCFSFKLKMGIENNINIVIVY